MDRAFLSSCLLLLILLGLCLWSVRSFLIPEQCMPFAGLSKERQADLLKRKFRFRAAALGLFALAALSLFSACPRGLTVLAVVIGFFFQYRVFRLRRRYPVGPNVEIRFPSPP